MALLFFKGGPTKHNAFINEAVIADLGGFPDHHTHAMVDEETSADRCSRMNLNSCQTPVEMRDEPGSGVPSFLI
jgi:hypothetical protein